MTESRQVTTDDVIDSMTKPDHYSGQIESLKARVEGLESLCRLLVDTFTSKQKLVMIDALNGGHFVYEKGFIRVDLTE